MKGNDILSQIKFEKDSSVAPNQKKPGYRSWVKNMKKLLNAIRKKLRKDPTMREVTQGRIFVMPEPPKFHYTIPDDLTPEKMTKMMLRGGGVWKKEKERKS